VSHILRSPRHALSLAVSLVALATFASPAAAGPLVSSATDCEAQTLERPFLPWADPAHYVLTPGGTFEDGSAAWDTTGNAAVVDGNESFYVHGAGESKSLRLPAGSSATSPAMCVGIEHPTLRLFARRSVGALLATLKVDVLFEDAYGTVQSLTIGTATGGPSWAPTIQMPVVANLLALLPGERTAIAFRFTARGGDWTIDDAYVDPYQSR
jgi:hypothetical protein